MPQHDSRGGGGLPDDYYRAFMKCWRDSSGDVIVRFHKTNVVTVRSNGDVVLFTNKYFTYTTMCSMNDALQFIDMQVSARGDVKDPGNWTVKVVGSSPQAFSDNMVVKARFADDKTRAKEVLDGLVPLLNAASGGGGGGGGGNSASGGGGYASGAAARTSAVAPVRTGAAPPPPVAAPAPPATAVASTAAAAKPPAGGSAWAASGSLAARLAADKEKEANARQPVVPGAVWVETKPAKKKKPAAAAAAQASAVPAAAGAGAGASSRAAAGPASSSATAAVNAILGPNASGGGGGAVYNDAGGATASLATPSSAITELFMQQASAWEDVGGDEGKLCVVCMHHRSDTILIPCSHAILCRSCAESVVQLTPGSGGECPVCRTPVDLVLDVA